MADCTTPGAAPRSARRAAAWLAAALGLTLPVATLALEPVFADGFEVCDASNWSFATGVPDCSTELTCATPGPGEACFAGRLLDVETSARICAPAPAGTACAGVGQGGPCALSVQVYDAVAFVQNPGGTPPLAAGEALIDDCGRFRVSGIAVPGSGFGAAASDDATGAADSHAPAAVIWPMTSGSKVERMRLYALAHATDEAWTVTAGDPFSGSTFAEVGTYAAVYLHAGQPAPGVELRSNGGPVPDADFYFSDASAATRSAIDPGLTATGANGSGLFAPASISTISGLGGEPPGCVWPSAPGGSGGGLLVVHEFVAEVAGQPGTPCP